MTSTLITLTIPTLPTHYRTLVENLVPPTVLHGFSRGLAYCAIDSRDQDRFVYELEQYFMNECEAMEDAEQDALWGLFEDPAWVAQARDIFYAVYDHYVSFLRGTLGNVRWEMEDVIDIDSYASMIFTLNIYPLD